MNKERLQAIIDRIEAAVMARLASPYFNETRIATLAQTDSGCELNISTARRDARIWLDLSNPQADYLFRNLRTLKEIKEFVKRHGDDYEYKFDKDGYDRYGYDRGGYDCEGYNLHGYDRNGYNCDGYDRAGFNRDGYDFDGLDKHNKPKTELTA